MDLTLTPKEFNLLRQFIYDQAGISLHDRKISMVQGRLSKRLRQLKLNNYMDYYHLLQNDPEGKELFYLIDAISTNVTSFFREPGQWEFLEEKLDEIVAKKQDRTLRIWSSASSSGEEPYSIAMFFKDNLPNFPQWDVKILATDISQDILKKAMRGSYDEKAVANLPTSILHRHFDKITENGAKRHVIKADLRSMILFRSFNLIHGNFSVFKRPFDIIFCRNVMIYFDPPSQTALVSRFAKLLEKGSYLFVGHSESLTRNKEEFKLMRSSVYQRI